LEIKGERTGSYLHYGGIIPLLPPIGCIRLRGKGDLARSHGEDLMPLLSGEGTYGKKVLLPKVKKAHGLLF